MERNDERGVDQVGSDLQDALYDLSREVSAFADDDDDDDFFESVKRTFTGDGTKRRSDDSSYYQNAKPYRRSTVDPIPDRIGRSYGRSYGRWSGQWYGAMVAWAMVWAIAEPVLIAPLALIKIKATIGMMTTIGCN